MKVCQDKMRKWRKKSKVFATTNTIYEGPELTLNAFKSGILPFKSTQRKGVKVSKPKQMFQRLSVALAQVQTGNSSEKILNEIKQIVYFASRKRNY